MYYSSIFFICISLLFVSTELVAQVDCGTVQPPEAFERLKANVASSESRLSGLNDVYIPIYFHLVGRDDGSGVIARSRALESICRINQKFEEIGFKFYIDSIAVINNNSLFTDNGGFENYLKPFYINVFILNTQSGAAGYYNFVDDYIVLKRAFGEPAYDDSYTFEHELGHFFSLFHTHHGWENLPYFPPFHGDTITILEVRSNHSRGFVEIELVDGSNCMDAGDGICDTPPDYGFTTSSNCDCCEMTFEIWDYNHDLIGPPMSDNMMAYSKGCDERFFTETQYAVMLSDYESLQRFPLRRNIKIDSFAPVVDKVVPVGPSGVLDTYNGFLFSWDEIPHATGYLLELHFGDQVLEYVTTDTEIFVSDLEPNVSYVWSVVPFNRFGSGCVEKEEAFFITGGETTSIDEDSLEDNFRIFPNPIDCGGQIFLDYKSQSEELARMTLYNINGAQFMDQEIYLRSGYNSVYTTEVDMTPGIYLLEIHTKNETLLEKVVIR